MKLKNRLDYRKRRHLSLRKKIKGTMQRPRMCVSVSNKYIYVQFIDDMGGSTLCAVTTASGKKQIKNNMVTAKLLGKKAAELALSKGITSAVFDRCGNAYHGKVKEIAEAARTAGIKI